VRFKSGSGSRAIYLIGILNSKTPFCDNYIFIEKKEGKIEIIEINAGDVADISRVKFDCS